MEAHRDLRPYAKRSFAKDVSTSNCRKRRKTINTSSDTRKWVFSSQPASANEDKFIIASYNLLGVENASRHLDLYSRISPQNLDWARRKRLISQELKDYNADVLCLQEVDRFDDLATLLGKDGYKGVYKGRTGEASDGCAVFWKANTFTLLHQEDIEFQKFNLRNNVAQFCVLEFKSKQLCSSSCGNNSPQGLEPTCPQLVLIGNIHVLFNPNRGDIKLGQVRLFLMRAHSISEKWGGIPVVIAGDLNSTPESAVYKYFSSSELWFQSYDPRQISGQLEFSRKRRCCKSHMSVTESWRLKRHRSCWRDEEILLVAGSESCTHLKHPLNLQSAYPGIPGKNDIRDEFGEPLATTCHSKFIGTVDYIWHSDKLVPVGVVETLPLDALRRKRGLPSGKWGSDHLALVCELAFLDTGHD